jgi:hypothetical protein
VVGWSVVAVGDDEYSKWYFPGLFILEKTLVALSSRGVRSPTKDHKQCR